MQQCFDGMHCRARLRCVQRFSSLSKPRNPKTMLFHIPVKPCLYCSPLTPTTAPFHQTPSYPDRASSTIRGHVGHFQRYASHLDIPSREVFPSHAVGRWWVPRLTRLTLRRACKGFEAQNEGRMVWRNSSEGFATPLDEWWKEHGKSKSANGTTQHMSVQSCYSQNHVKNPRSF